MNYRILVAGVFWPEYSYISKQVKNWPTHKPRYGPPWKILFINAIQPFYGCQRNARKNITVTVSVRVSVTVRVRLGWFVSSNSLVALSVAISWPSAKYNMYLLTVRVQLTTNTLDHLYSTSKWAWPFKWKRKLVDLASRLLIIITNKHGDRHGEYQITYRKFSDSIQN